MKSLRNPAALAAISVLFLCVLLTSAGRSMADENSGPPAGLGMARVTLIKGDTSFNSEDTDEWAALSPNFTLRDGDRLWSGEGESRIEVQFSGGHMAWVNYQTELDIIKMERDRGRAFQVTIAEGEAIFYTRHMRPGDVFQVDTPNASIRAFDRAHFRVTTLQDGTSQVGVSLGKVEIETPDGLSDLNGGEMAEITQDGQVYISGLPAPDGWDRWVDTRWDLYKTPPRSARYLPPDMSDYGYEFDAGGRWVSAPDYGSVWVPAVDPAWSPYSNGRWVFVAGDYVWLPYDAWYAPFHYGRWSFAVSIGWFWLPPPVAVVSYWSPGYVGWSWGGDVVSWVPLAPHETYYGYGYYGPESVNVNVTKVTVIKNVYINSTVNNSVVVVNRNNFLRGDVKRIAVTEKQNPFRHPGAMGARPLAKPPARDIKPVRESRMPKPGVAPKALPPRQVEKVLPVVKQRAIAREQGTSAFKPGKTPPKVPIRELGKKVPFRQPEAAPGAGGEVKRPGERPGARAGRPGAPESGGVEKGRPAPPGREKQRVAPEEKTTPPAGNKERRIAPDRERVAPAERAPGEQVPTRLAPPGREMPGVVPESRTAPSGGIEARPGGIGERPVAPGAKRGQVRPEAQVPSEQAPPERRPGGAPQWRRSPRAIQPEVQGRPRPAGPLEKRAPVEKRPGPPKEEKRKRPPEEPPL